MKRSSIMQAGETAQPDVRQTVSGAPASVVVSIAAVARADAVVVGPTAATTPASAVVRTVAIAPTAAVAPSTLTDTELYCECRKVGAQIRRWTGKFEPLLLEMFERRLYKKYFSTIHEFAYKIAGFNKEKVDKILRLSRKLEDKPVLKQAFASGEVGYSKLNSFIHLVTPDNEQAWTTRAKTMPRVHLELRVREERSDREEVTPGGNSTGLELTGEMGGGNCVAAKSGKFGMMRDISFKVDPDTERELRALQSKLEQERGEKLSFGEVIKILIKKEHTDLIEKAQRKKTINYCPDCVKKRADEAAVQSEAARGVPAEIRHTILARQNYRCVGGNIDFERVVCTHPTTELHHLDGWALTKKHDPDRIRYLCKKHHAEMHAEDSRVQAYRSG